MSDKDRGLAKTEYAGTPDMDLHARIGGLEQLNSSDKRQQNSKGVSSFLRRSLSAEKQSGEIGDIR